MMEGFVSFRPVTDRRVTTGQAKDDWHELSPGADFLGDVGLNLAFGLVTSCCGHQTA